MEKESKQMHKSFSVTPYGTNNKKESEMTNVISFVSSVLNEFKDLIQKAEIKSQDISIEEVMKWSVYQTRLRELCDEHVKYLQEMISIGKILDAIVVLEDYYGVNMIIEGNHRRWAYFLSGLKFIKVIMVPRSIWSKFSPIELVQIGMEYNGLPTERKLEINKKDTKDFMYKYIQDGNSVVDLPAILRSFGYTPKETTSLMKYADRIHRHHKIVGSLGKDFTYKNWNKKVKTSDGKQITRLALKVKSEKAKTPGTAVFGMSSANFSWNKILFTLSKSKISSNKVKILIHHPDYVALEDWNNKWKDEHETVQAWMNKLIPSIEFEMEELDWKQLNPKLSKAS